MDMSGECAYLPINAHLLDVSVCFVRVWKLPPLPPYRPARPKMRIFNCQLTPRETEVLRLMVDGYTANEIGAKLGKSGRTVEVQTHNLRRKLNVRTSMQLVAEFVRAEMLMERTALTSDLVILRNALREIGENAALTSVADCKIIAEEALRAIARGKKANAG